MVENKSCRLVSFRLVGLKEARKRKEEVRQLLEQGKHPVRERKAQKLRNIAKDANTFEKIARRWLELKRPNMNVKYHRQCIARMEQHVFPLIGSLPVEDITIPDVVRVVEKIAERGTIETAKRMKQLIGQTFRYATQRGMCVHNPASDLRDILPTREEKHHPCVEPHEVPQLLNDIEQYKGDDLTRLLMKLMALTFVRTREIIEAKWDEIDWERAEWHIPKERMKRRQPHFVPLSEQSLDILRQIHVITGDKENIFYSSRSKSRHMSNGSVLMALRRMGYQGRMSGHGFRAVASTILNGRAYRPDVIEAQLAHAERDKVRDAYNNADYPLERKKMMQDYADILDAMREGKWSTPLIESTF